MRLYRAYPWYSVLRYPLLHKVFYNPMGYNWRRFLLHWYYIARIPLLTWYYKKFRPNIGITDGKPYSVIIGDHYSRGPK